MEQTKKPDKLAMWQERLKRSDEAYDPEREKMNRRERLYNGERRLSPLVPGDKSADGGAKKTSHVRNIIFENIESCVSASIPQPKVTPRKKEDEGLAALIEHFLRNELDRLPFEEMNDMAERTVPLQGGAAFMVDWDNRKRTHDTVGEEEVKLLHPKQFAPQPGVYGGVEDMDWWITKFPTTKTAVARKYGKDVSDEGESEPEIRAVDGAKTEEDAVTLYVGIEHNKKGSYDRYIWCNDTELEDLEDYQARRQPVCAKCGRVKPLPGQVISNRGNMEPVREDGEAERAAGMAIARELMGVEELAMGGALEHIGVQPEVQHYDGGACPWCGCETFTSKAQEFEQVMLPIRTKSGLEIPGAKPGYDEEGRPALKPTLIPFYKPDVFPIVLQKSVSVHGKLLGNSDADVIEDQQNTINRLEQKIIDRLVKAGTRITLPDRADFRTDPEDSGIWYIGNPSDKALIDVYEFSGDLQYELLYLANVYEEARQLLGITDSFQGRKDTTATSGKAKEFSAAQAAGRLESKRVMKNAAYAKLFEVMFKYWLAYSDEPRPVSYQDYKGETVYEEFNRYDFLRQDSDGTYWWNDQFLFSCDTSAPLESNREAMWQETRMNLESGAFGDPKSTETLILFWGKMELLHYPGAGETKKFLEERLRREQQAMQMQQEAQNAALSAANATHVGLEQAITEKARQDALSAAKGQMQGRNALA